MNDGIQVFTPEVTGAIVKSEIESQLDAAHKYPRNLTLFKENAIMLATQDMETAESCIYHRPVGDGKIAEGMSIRMAEIVASYYGNIRVVVRIISQTDREVMVQGVAIDLESNASSMSDGKALTVKKNGQPYSESQRIVVAKATLAKARRDVIFQIIPRPLCKPIMDAVKAKLRAELESKVNQETKPKTKRKSKKETKKTLPGNVQRALVWTDSIGAARKDVYRVLEIENEYEIGSDHIIKLMGLRTAIEKEGIPMKSIFEDVAEQKQDDKKEEIESKKEKIKNNSIQQDLGLV